MLLHLLISNLLDFSIRRLTLLHPSCPVSLAAIVLPCFSPNNMDSRGQILLLDSQALQYSMRQTSVSLANYSSAYPISY